MADRALTLMHSGEPGQRPGAPTLSLARSLLMEHKRAEAQLLLSTSLASGEFEKASDRSTALLALAMLADQDGDLETSLGLLDTAQTALALSGDEWEFVRWDLLLARAATLSRAGRIADSAACARTALALFNDSDHSVAWHRLMLLDFELLSMADGDESHVFLLSKALGVLRLREVTDVRRWLLLQVGIFQELVKRDSAGVAAQHASLVLRALPADILGVDRWWATLREAMGRIGEAAGDVDLGPILNAFEVLEREYETGRVYERNAPLLPRQRMLMQP